MINFFSVMYSVCVIFILVYACIYIFLKYYKKDKRLVNVNFFTFLFDTRKILKGE